MRLKKNDQNYFFHRFEMSFCGYTDSGKTTLISKLTNKLSSKFDIGYLKHDAHKFEMDKSGKDTSDIYNSGAKSILINDDIHFAHVNKAKLTQIDVIMMMQDSDFLFIEDHIDSPLPKLIILYDNERDKETISLIERNKIQNIAAIISDQNQDPFAGKYPFINKEDIDHLSTFILDNFKEKIPKKLNALILAGGKSTRMNETKGALSYHGNINQIEHTRQVLSNFCDDVFVSCTADQKGEDFLIDQNLIIDSFPSVSPTTGIISAQHQHNSVAWLVVACDLPYITTHTIENLVKNRNPFKLATAYLNNEKNWPEPLCTIYEPKSSQKLHQYFSVQKYCPRKVLFNSNIHTIELNDSKALTNINTPKERDDAISELSNLGGQ